MAMRPQGKAILGLVALLLGGAILLYFASGRNSSTKSSNSNSKESTWTKIFGGGKKAPLRISVVTWGGYVGGQYYNRGFAPGGESLYTKNHNMDVQFVLNDDVNSSIEAFKSGDVDLHWGTFDSFSTQVEGLSSNKPVFVFAVDFSRGGDKIVATREIISINQLKGKKVSVALGTPSHTLLLRSLQAAGMTINDVQVIGVGSAPEAANIFKNGQSDAAVVWSPDDEDCLKAVQGSRVLVSTKDASGIIADGFFAKESFIKEHPEELKALYDGWMTGAAEINSNPQAKNEAIEMLARELNISSDAAEKAINNTRLCTHGDNLNFFGLNGGYTGVRGEELYTQTYQLFASVKSDVPLVPASLPPWRTIASVNIIRSSSLKPDGINIAESGVKYSAPKQEQLTQTALASKPLSVEFATGSAALDETAKAKIDKEFVPTAKGFRTRIRIVGNTDNVGSEAENKKLSWRRANAVAEYLAKEYGFDTNRFVIDGKGPSNPVADNSTAEGRSRNRRTDFEQLPNN